MAVTGAYVLAGELALADGDYAQAIARYETRCRAYMECNQDIALNSKEMQLPGSWAEIEEQNAMLRAMRDAPAGAPPGSISDLIAKAANGIALPDYPTQR